MRVHPNVAHLVADSGKLIGVTGLAAEGDRFMLLAFEFPTDTLILRCAEDTDEILIEIFQAHPAYPNVAHQLLGGLIGMTIEYAWLMTNHRGYTDAFQLRLTDGSGQDETRQFEVGASAMDVRRVIG